MTFPRSEYPSEAAGLHQPHVERAGGGVNISRQRRQVDGIFAAAVLAGGCLVTAAALGTVTFLVEPPQSPMPFVYATLFFFSAAVVLALSAGGMVGRLLAHIHQAHVVMETQDRGLIELGFDNRWLLARLNGRASAAGDSGGSREGATSPAANVYPINTKPRGRFQ